MHRSLILSWGALITLWRIFQILVYLTTLKVASGCACLMLLRLDNIVHTRLAHNFGFAHSN
jgi:hypothetical protein